MLNKRIKIEKLPFGDTTNDGAFSAKVDGELIGNKERCLFETREEATKCAEEYIRLSSACVA